LTWEQTRPIDEIFFERRDAVKAKGGWWARARLQKLHAKPNDPPLLAITFSSWPALMLDGALYDTDFEGTPAHYSIAYENEVPDWLMKRLAKKWSRPRRILVSVININDHVVAEIGKTCPVGRCRLIAQAKACGAYKGRMSHVSL
jgi:hypothetical protein